MLGIVSSSMRLRTLVVAAAAVLISFGGWQLRGVPLDVVPEFSPLSIEVKTEALGLSSAEVEALITVPLEADLLNGVPFLQKIQSESAAGVSSIEMFFSPGTDLLQARQMVQERLTQAHALPNVSSPPVMLQPVSSASRIMNIGLSSKSVSLIEMTVQAHWNIVPRLVGVPGVSNVAIWGRRQRQVQVEVDPARLHVRGVTLEQVVKTAGEAVFASPLTYLNSSTPGTGGFIDTPNQRLNIRHLSPIVTPAHFARVPIHESNLALGEVARVVEGHQPLIGDAIVGDGPGILLVVEKFPGFNTQQVTRAVEAAMAELRPGLSGVEIDTSIYRPAGFIERATGNLVGAASLALALAAVALLLVLWDVRALLIAAVTIPLSLLAAALVLHLRGVNMDMLVLSGLLLAIGAIVHDAVLDTEAVANRPLPAGTSRASQLLTATIEARGPMVFATLIVLIAAAPVLFLEGLSAAFFRPLVMAYAVAIVVSFLVALVVAPAIGALVLRRDGADAPRPGGPFGGAFGLYRRLAEPATRTIVPSAAIAGVALLITLGAWTRLDRELLPSFRETDVLVEWQAPQGTSLPAMTRVTGSLLADLRAIPGVRRAAAQIGRAVLCNCDDVADVNSAEVWVSIDPKAPYEPTLAAMREVIAGYPGMVGDVETYLSKKMREALTGDDEKITVRVYGHDLKILRAKADEIHRLMASVPGVVNPRIELQAEQPTIEVEVDLDRAAVHGFKPGDIRRATSAMIGGITVGALFEEQKVFDVVVWGTAGIRDNIQNVQDLMLDTENGRQVRLADVAHVRTAPAPSIIRRQGVSRRVDIDADIGGRSISAVTRDVSAKLAAVTFPFEYHAQLLGEHAERREALRSVDSYLVAAAVLIFLLLQSVLRSWRLAAASALGVPVVLGGCALAVLVSGRVVSLGTLLGGMAALLVTVRIGIAMVRQFQDLERRDGMAFGPDLVARGLRERFGSTLATLLGTAAIAFAFAAAGNVAGLEIAHPMAVAMLGGLFGAAATLLVLVPAIYLRLGGGTAFDTLGLGPEPAHATGGSLP